jgi:hypothetical protein
MTALDDADDTATVAAVRALSCSSRCRGRPSAARCSRRSRRSRLPATTLATYRAVVSAVSSSERACERVRACDSMSVRVRVCVYERASMSM